MGKPRSSAATGDDFPYESRTTCYIEVAEDGTVSQGVDTEAYQRAVAGKSRLFAVWPGQYSSDLFAIDDLDAYARAVGLIHDVKRTGLAEHKHQVRWQVSQYEQNPSGSYISVEVVLVCGRAIRDIRASLTTCVPSRDGTSPRLVGGVGMRAVIPCGYAAEA
jgi:hypothetical protein